MKNLDFNEIEFLAASLKAPFPVIKDERGEILKEIAIVGRSNVGKSSLINHFFNQKIAKTSSIPGKTQTINFFKINNQFILVDLPGYGYAKRSKEEKFSFSKVIDEYLKNKNLSLILFLLDIRRDLNEDDLTFFSWAASQNINLVVILTKCDKISSSELQKNSLKISNCLNKINCKIIKKVINYSIKQKEGKVALEAFLKIFLKEKK